MKLEFVDDPPIILRLKALAQLLVGNGVLKLEDGQDLYNATLEGGTLKVDVADPVKGLDYIKLVDIVYHEFTLADLRDALTGCTFCTWAKNEEGEDVLACFG